MEFKDKINQSVAAAVAKIMGEALHPNQQKLDVHEPEKDKLTADDFKKLRAGKKPDMKNEEVENLDEVSLKTATSAYVKRMGKDDDKSPVKAVKTMDHIAKKHGVVGVARAAKAADKEYGLNDPVHNKRKDFVKGVMAGVKEEVEQLDELSTKTLASAAKSASDPDSDYHYGKSHDPQKFADHAKKTKDAKSAAAVQGAADAKGHYARPGHTLGSYDKLAHRTPARVTSAGKANKQDVNRLKGNIQRNEDVEQMDEVKMADLPSTKVQGRSYGASKPEPHAVDVLDGPKDKELKSIESEKKKPVKEDIELTLDDYLLEELVEFVMSEEFQQLDELSKSTLGSYVTKASKDLRSNAQAAGSKDTALMAHQMGYRRGEKSPIKGGTKGEKRVSSEITKHQTKASNRTAGIAGAAQRLAKEQFEITEEDAYDKNVKPSDKPHDKDAAKKRAQTSAVAARKIMSMSAYSAKKNAIKEETESEHYKAGHEYASDHAQDSGFKVTARARKKEMLADNPHKKGTKEHTDWHQGALHGHQTGLDNM